MDDSRRASSEKDDSAASEMDKRWQMVESRFKAFDTHQAASAKSLILPRKVKTQFARDYVEAERKTHLELVKDNVKEEVSRLRLRVLYTAVDAKQLLGPGEGGAESSVDRLAMRLALQNMTLEDALTTYQHLRDEHLRGDSSGSENSGHKALSLTQFRTPLATFAFHLRLRTRAQKEYIQAAVRAAHAVGLSRM